MADDYVGDKFFLTSFLNYHASCSRLGKNGKNNYRRKARCYCHEGGTLFYNHTKYGMLRVIKDSDKNAILQGCHSDAISGHQGVNCTEKKISERYYWPGMCNDIRDFIRACDECQHQNHLMKILAPLLPIQVKDEAFAMVGMDLVGPLHETEQGCRYIAVMTDYFTKWPEVKAIRSKSAIEIAEFVTEVICRHGTPRVILTDQGREFCNEINEELCRRLNIEHKVTSAYHPQTNGLTERFNKTLCNSLVKYANDKQDNWDKYLQMVAFATRTCVQKSTNETPFYLVYGRKAVLPIQLDLPSTFTNPPTELDDDLLEKHLEERTSSFVQLLETGGKAKTSITKAQKKQKELYDRRQQQVKLVPGDQVLVKNPRKHNRKGDKMTKRYIGPYKISSHVGKGVYKLEGRKALQNVKNLRKYVTLKRSTTDAEEHPAHVQTSCYRASINEKPPQEKTKRTLHTTKLPKSFDKKRAKNQATTEDRTPRFSRAGSRRKPSSKIGSPRSSSVSTKKHVKDRSQSFSTAAEHSRHAQSPHDKFKASEKSKPQQFSKTSRTLHTAKATRSHVRNHLSREAPMKDRSSKSPKEGTKKRPGCVAKETTSSSNLNIEKFINNGTISEILVHCDNLRMPLPPSPQKMMTIAKESATLSFYWNYQQMYPTEQEECGEKILEWYVSNGTSLGLQHPPTAVMLASSVMMATLKDGMELSSVYATLSEIPLQKGAVKLINNTFRVPQKKFSVGSVTLDPSDVRTLLPGKWLNDQVIHAYLGLLNSSTTYVLPSFIAVHWEVGNFKWIYPQIPLHNYHHVLVPICHQHHWLLLVAEMKTRIVTVLDPIPNNHRTDKFIGHWRKFMETRERILKEPPTTWTVGKNESSRQDDSSSCGVFLLMNTDAVTQGKLPSIMRQCHVMSYRKYIMDQVTKFAKPVTNNCNLLFCISDSAKEMFQCVRCYRMCHKACLGVCEGADVSMCILCV